MQWTIGKLLTVGLVSAGVVGLVVALRPRPLEVDIASIDRGPLLVTVDEDGKTRIRDRYVVSTPLAGRLRRIDLDPGDPVTAEETAVATIEPTDPALLDARARAEAEARVQAAEAAVRRAAATYERARNELDHAEDDHAHVEEAFSGGGANRRELEIAATLLRTRHEELRVAQFAREIAEFELRQAESAFVRTRRNGEDGADGASPFTIRSPISGQVLRVFQESVAVVTPGTALLELGDPTDLEIVIDVLSTDAVRIRSGAEVIVERWGGDTPLAAVVRLVEPSAYTKISALGVEEQRVDVIADFVSPPESRPALGDGFRVETRIVRWSSDDALLVPVTALFRDGETWAVFVASNGRAAKRHVEIGYENGLNAEVRDGLDAGETVIENPSDQLEDGGRVRRRAAG